MILIDSTFFNSIEGINILNEIIESISNKSRKKFKGINGNFYKNSYEYIVA